jgi:hypothetical protein
MLYAVLKGTNWLNKYLGQTSLYILRKFFGIIVLAIACKLMFGNLADVFVQSTKSTDKKIQQTEEIIQPVIETSSDSVLIK